MRRDDQVVVVELEVAHRRRRQVELECLPVVAIVERDEDSALRARDEQTLPHRVLLDRVHIDAFR